MIRGTFAKMSDNLDFFISNLLLIAVFSLLVVSAIFNIAISYSILINLILIMIFCSIYIVKIRSNIEFNDHFFSTCSNYRLHNIRFITLCIIFCVAYSSLFLLIINNHSNISRPLISFYIELLLIVILGLEIIQYSYDNRKQIIILLQTIGLSFSFIVIPLYVSADLIGIDPNIHRNFVQSVLLMGHIPIDFSYSLMPVMHLLIGITILFTESSYNFSTLLSVDIIQMVSIVFIFLFGKKLFTPQIGLLAALLLSCGTYFVHMGFSVRPITLGAIIIMIILYLVYFQNRSLSIDMIILLMCLTLILTHSIATASLLIILFSLWFGFVMYRFLYRDSEPIPLSFVMASLIMLAAVSWWIYASSHFDIIVNIVDSGFDVYRWKPVASSNISMGNDLDLILNSLGFNIFISFAFVGLFSIISRNIRNNRTFSLFLVSMVMMSIIFLSMVLDRNGLFVARWYPILQMILVIPAALGIIALIFSLTGNKKITYLMLFLGILVVVSSLMVTSPSANPDNPIYSKDMFVRYYLTDSEAQAGQTILLKTTEKISSDPYYMSTLAKSYNDYTYDHDSELFILGITSGNLDLLKGYIIIRAEIINKTFYSGFGSYKLTYDLDGGMNAQRFDKLYSSKSVLLFYK